MTTADEKLVQVIEKASEARVTLGQPPVSSTLPTSRQRLPTQLDYVSVNDVIRIVKPYFKEETTFERWISSLACEVSEDGQASIAGNIGLADILNNVNERIFIKFPSVLSLLEHPKTLHRAVGKLISEVKVRSEVGKSFIIKYILTFYSLTSWFELLVTTELVSF